jgi:hypothetical protein
VRDVQKRCAIHCSVQSYEKKGANIFPSTEVAKLNFVDTRGMFV